MPSEEASPGLQTSLTNSPASGAVQFLISVSTPALVPLLLPSSHRAVTKSVAAVSTGLVHFSKTASAPWLSASPCSRGLAMKSTPSTGLMVLAVIVVSAPTLSESPCWHATDTYSRARGSGCWQSETVASVPAVLESPAEHVTLTNC